MSIALRSNRWTSYPREFNSPTSSTPSWPELPKTIARLDIASKRILLLHAARLRFPLWRDLVEEALGQPAEFRGIVERVLQFQPDSETIPLGTAVAYLAQ